MNVGLTFSEKERCLPHQRRGCCSFPAPLQMQKQYSFLSCQPSMIVYRLPSLKEPLFPKHCRGNRQILIFLSPAFHRAAWLLKGSSYWAERHTPACQTQH